MKRASIIHLYTSTPPLTCDESRKKSSCGQDGNRRNRGRGELAATVTGKVNTWTQRGATIIFIINCKKPGLKIEILSSDTMLSFMH
jgi:hypothetical protein